MVEMQAEGIGHSMFLEGVDIINQTGQDRTGQGGQSVTYLDQGIGHSLALSLTALLRRLSNPSHLAPEGECQGMSDMVSARECVTA